MRRVLVVLILWLGSPASGSDDWELPPLKDSTVSQYVAAIEPAPGEVAFLKVAWQSQLGRAVQDAHRNEKPLLIYVMNGHPLGCT